MKPEFALSLSFDGIRLLHRAAGGWHAVGSVDVGTANLNKDLGALRKKAHAVKTKRVRTKLIIPDDQIKYLTIDTGDVDDDARRDAARIALDGATPYPVDALAFDISTEGARTHIAAVARETLTEAEAFAVEHKFHPVSFVAAPEGDGFLGEPFFGQTAYAVNVLPDGAKVEPDGIRVVVVAPPDPDPEPAETAETSESEPQKDAAPAPDPAQDATPAAQPDAAPRPKPQLLENPVEPDLAAKPDATPDAAPKDDEQPDSGPAAPDQDPDTDPDPAEDVDGSALMGFATRRRANGGTAAPLGGVTRDPPARKPAARLTVGDAPADADTPTPVLNPQQAAAESLRAAPPIAALPDDPVPPPVDKPADKGGFLSRRKPKRVPPAPPAASGARAARTAQPAPATGATAAEAQRMTVFGARADVQVGGKPRFLGLILTAILLVFLAGVAAWASVFLDDGLAKLFPKRERTLASTLPADAVDALAEDVGATIDLEPTGDSGDELIVASLNEGLSDGLTAEDAAVLDALRDPQPDPAAQQELDKAALEARYAVTGIWPRAPQTPPPPTDLIQLEDLYITGIDPISPALDAIALPGADSFLTDVALPDVTSPPAAGTNFAFDENGRIVPTEDGALSPDGFTVFLGRPPVEPPADARQQAEETPDTQTVPDAATRQLAAQRPRARPADLVEQNERATLGGLSRSELALLRPRLRPAAPQEAEVPQDVDEPDLAEAEAAATISPLAAAQSYRPQTRPGNFDRIVARASRAEPTPARVAAVAPRTVTPSIPSSASVAREATVRNAINLSRVNLIGVYGTPSNRRALVRLKNGRYQKVKVGDRFDGGRVSAIGDSELRYQKGNRNVVLKMPSG
ncbi:hypothetical protein [uncultured Tateyamaria sp.]|uniref:hypothetical protein n=1 Tax=uncultured Tateyamaria sp. TaxID=455651 RepID=UPI0026329301|nr:hypothetical protein [uncultured Tateyamaria sp.]